ncbi:hypothetical protein MAPG_00251 [Magnaporthiopsis poae ATCC 64411]|uniref:Uncharacterized protein n=1 Tax=Magnaporthiopsis poae (strain ATCC 64411 / 73-15) TaxID=644358 RepID=A0A0C4DKH8_MAGP6|nr:hypothetical protein MAPG_00251 [Magnaporthiopsis poae ATCC 64411]
MPVTEAEAIAVLVKASKAVKKSPEHHEAAWILAGIVEAGESLPFRTLVAISRALWKSRCLIIQQFPQVLFQKYTQDLFSKSASAVTADTSLNLFKGLRSHEVANKLSSERSARFLAWWTVYWFPPDSVQTFVNALSSAAAAYSSTPLPDKAAADEAAIWLAGLADSTQNPPSKRRQNDSTQTPSAKRHQTSRTPTPSETDQALGTEICPPTKPVPIRAASPRAGAQASQPPGPSPFPSQPTSLSSDTNAASGEPNASLPARSKPPPPDSTGDILISQDPQTPPAHSLAAGLEDTENSAASTATGSLQPDYSHSPPSSTPSTHTRAPSANTTASALPLGNTTTPASTGQAHGIAAAQGFAVSHNDANEVFAAEPSPPTGPSRGLPEVDHPHQAPKPTTSTAASTEPRPPGSFAHLQALMDIPGTLTEEYQKAVAKTFYPVGRKCKLHWRTSLGYVRVDGVPVGGGDIDKDGNCEIEAGSVAGVQAGFIKVEYSS